VLLLACEKPDASHLTSPSAVALAGTATGAVAYGLPDPPPTAVPPPEGWRFDLGNARFSRLENGAASIQVVDLLHVRPGAAFEVWLGTTAGTVARWSGGLTHPYDGTLCFQVRLQDGSEALVLDPAADYTLTLAFRDPGSSALIAAHPIRVAGFPPRLRGAPPAQSSAVFRDLLGCPRAPA
jgi:hypothetical protein